MIPSLTLKHMRTSNGVKILHCVPRVLYPVPCCGCAPPPFGFASHSNLAWAVGTYACRYAPEPRCVPAACASLPTPCGDRTERSSEVQGTGYSSGAPSSFVPRRRPPSPKSSQVKSSHVKSPRACACRNARTRPCCNPTHVQQVRCHRPTQQLRSIRWTAQSGNE